MARYRRFAAYVYEYVNGRKGENVGFIKVEVRNCICTMEICLHSIVLKDGDVGMVYGFLRNSGLMDGILLGSCESGSGVLRGTLTADADDLGGAGVSVDQLSGMIILMGTGGFFGTEWDDEAIRPDHFRERKVEEKEAVIDSSAAENSIEEAMNMGEENVMPEAWRETENASQNLTSQEVTEDPTLEDQQNGERMSFQSIQEPQSNYVHQQSQESQNSYVSQLPQEPQTSYTSQSSQELWSSNSTPLPGAFPKQDTDFYMQENCGNKNDSREEERSCTQSAMMNQQSTEASCDCNFYMENQSADDSCMKDEERSCCPFSECDMLECARIKPQDLCRYSRHLCPLRGNRFLQQGYRNFGHILLCKRESGQYILGVPGRYDQQERFSAEMFGFPFFRECALIHVRGGKGGYWYRMVDVEDIH